MKVHFEELLALTASKLQQAGLSPQRATITAEAICTASLRGTDSHGIRLLPHYLQALASGRIDPRAEFEYHQTNQACGTLDAHHGMGHVAVAEAMRHAMDLADSAGVGFVTVANSSHCGSMAYYGLFAPPSGMIGLAFTNATAKVKVFGAKQPFFGINPVCFTAPMASEDPFCYDASPTVMPNNRVKLYKERGLSLPPGVAADADGQETLDPDLARMLLPLGGEIAGYKGYAMAMVVDILCSLLSGMPSGPEVSAMYEADGASIAQPRHLGQLVGAIRIDSFVDPDRFAVRLQENANRIRSLQPTGPEPVLVPGDPEKREARLRHRDGIEIDAPLLAILQTDS